MALQTAKYHLAPAMRAEDCEGLDAFLRSHENVPVVIDCSATTRLAGQAAQVVAAHHKLRTDGAKITFDGVSQELASMIDRLGMTDLLPQMRGVS